MSFLVFYSLGGSQLSCVLQWGTHFFLLTKSKFKFSQLFVGCSELYRNITSWYIKFAKRIPLWNSTQSSIWNPLTNIHAYSTNFMSFLGNFRPIFFETKRFPYSRPKYSSMCPIKSTLAYSPLKFMIRKRVSAILKVTKIQSCSIGNFWSLFNFINFCR